MWFFLLLFTMRTMNVSLGPSSKISISSWKRDLFRKTFSGTKQKFRITQLKTKTLQQSLARTVLCLSCDHMLQDANPGSMCAPQRYQADPVAPCPHSPAGTGWSDPQALPSPGTHFTTSSLLFPLLVGREQNHTQEGLKTTNYQPVFLTNLGGSNLQWWRFHWWLTIY